MCIIITVPQGKAAPERELVEYAWDSNPHYGGVMYINEHDKVDVKRWKSKKGIIDGFYRTLDRYSETSPVVLHMRYATDGEVSIENTHPFYVKKGEQAFCHNGRIHECVPKGQWKEEGWSDTRVFNEIILKKMPADWISHDGIVDLVTKYIGPSSRLVVLNAFDRNAWIINHDKGEWINDCWFSNDYYKSRRSKWIKGDRHEMIAGEWVNLTPKKQKEVTTNNVVGFRGYSEYGGLYSAYGVPLTEPKPFQKATVKGMSSAIRNCDGCAKKVMTSRVCITNVPGHVESHELRMFYLCPSCRGKLMRWVGMKVFKDDTYTFKQWEEKKCNGNMNGCEVRATGYDMTVFIDAGMKDVEWWCTDCYKEVKHVFTCTFGPKRQWFDKDIMEVK